MTASPFPTRSFGVLLHPSSLPGRDLIGTLGDRAHAFVDWLAGTGARVWQILPLTINGDGDSPYFSSSAFAGNLWLIDLELLHGDGLLERAELRSMLHDHDLDGRVDFEELYDRKLPLLQKAADRFLADPDHARRADYEAFVADAAWVADTCLFFALRESLDGAEWWDWPEPLRRRDPDALAEARSRLAVAIGRWQAMLFFFETQWRALREAAHQRGLVVLGDLPIYVAPDSADVWANQDQFMLDADGHLLVQSGVPPDYFSATGQLWGNPLYRWDVMASDGYAWWLARLRRCLELSDVVRIDHFRALSAYWEVDADAEDAIGGRWLDGPGQAFLDAVRAEFPGFPFVAEDLGTLDAAVHELRDHYGLHGMRILQFGFDGTHDNPHLPGAIAERSIVYTGTHDNEPIAAWWAGLDPATRATVAVTYQHPPGIDVGRATWSFIEAAFGSPAEVAVVPMQDPLVLDDRARMNDPSTATGNWGWRMPADALSPGLARSLRTVAARYRR